MYPTLSESVPTSHSPVSIGGGGAQCPAVLGGSAIKGNRGQYHNNNEMEHPISTAITTIMTEPPGVTITTIR